MTTKISRFPVQGGRRIECRLSAPSPSLDVSMLAPGLAAIQTSPYPICRLPALYAARCASPFAFRQATGGPFAGRSLFWSWQTPERGA